jgi:hypothetical protein
VSSFANEIADSFFVIAFPQASQSAPAYTLQSNNRWSWLRGSLHERIFRDPSIHTDSVEGDH